MNLLTKCLFCNSNLKKINLKLPSFTHLNFDKINKKINLKQCNSCSLIINNSLHKEKIKFFNLKKYFLHSNNQKIFFKNKIYNKHEAQFQFLFKKKLLYPNVKVLDIGCNIGNLIELIKNKVINAKVKGYDPNPYIQRYLKKKKYFFDYKISEDSQKFDLIILSHSLMYIKNINFLIKKLKSNLSTKGKIFIELSDIFQSPYYLLMGDQYYFFTPENLKNIFLKNSLYPKFYYPKILKGNFITIIQNKKIKKIILKKNNILKPIKYLSNISKYLKKIKNKNIFIFGTTVKAAFLNFFLKNKVISFVDEGSDKNFFCNKKVVHPKSLDKNSFILVPLKDKKNILKKLTVNYKGNFKVI